MLRSMTVAFLSHCISLKYNKVAGFIPVSIINLRCDFLSELHKVILGQRPRHYLRSIFNEAVSHLLNTPEQGCLVRLSDKHIYTLIPIHPSKVWSKTKMSQSWVNQRGVQGCVYQKQRGNLHIPRRACAISVPIPSEWPRAPAPGVNLQE